jgi:hypothetical protein
MGPHTHPTRYHNVLANPAMTIEVEAEVLHATAHLAPDGERDATFDSSVTGQPQLAHHPPARTNHPIPMLVLARGRPSRNDR